MNCKDCGRPLQKNENDYCPYCRNKRNKNVKTGITVGGAILAVGGAVLAAIFGGKGKKK